MGWFARFLGWTGGKIGLNAEKIRFQNLCLSNVMEKNPGAGGGGGGRLNPLGIRRVEDINASSLSDNKPTICEGNLTLKERYGALSNLPANKAPGNDDLSRELYLVFFDLVGNDVLASLNYSYQLGELSNSQRQAIMTLVEKKGNDKKINQELEKMFCLPQNVILSTCLTFDNSVHFAHFSECRASFV